MGSKSGDFQSRYHIALKRSEMTPHPPHERVGLDHEVFVRKVQVTCRRRFPRLFQHCRAYWSHGVAKWPRIPIWPKIPTLTVIVKHMNPGTIAAWAIFFKSGP